MLSLSSFGWDGGGVVFFVCPVLAEETTWRLVGAGPDGFSLCKTFVNNRNGTGLSRRTFHDGYVCTCFLSTHFKRFLEGLGCFRYTHICTLLKTYGKTKKHNSATRADNCIPQKTSNTFKALKQNTKIP